MPLYIRTVIVLYIFVCLLCYSGGQTLDDEKKLYTDVFANLQKEVVPNYDKSKPLYIAIRFYLMTITKFVETEETIVLNGGFLVTWNDGGISWNPASYGNKFSIALSQQNIWTPPLYLLNTVDALQPIEGDTSFLAKIQHDGSVSWVIGNVLSAKCPTDISKFPYDTQKCSLQFAVLNMLESDIILSAVPEKPVDLSFYTVNSDWTLQSYAARTYSWNNWSTYEITLTIKRESLYYSIMVVCPTLVFALLNPLVFWLPVESGERIGLSMTILLSYAIFLTLVFASIPPSSNPMCILLIIMMVTIIVSGIIVVMAIFISSIYFQEESNKINNIWKFFGTRISCNKKINSVKPFTDEKNTECNNSETITWKDVASGLDLVCMFVSYGVIVIIISSYFLYVKL